MPLPDDKRIQLDSIVSKMESGGKKPEDIQFVVNDFKSKFGSSESVQPVVGELRRREGQGEISASKENIPTTIPEQDWSEESMRELKPLTPEEKEDTIKSAKMVAPLVAGMAVPGVGTGITGAIATGALSGLASGVTKQTVGNGQGSLGDRALDVAGETAFGAGAGGVLGVAGKYLPKAYQAAKSLFTGSPRQAVTQTIRPFKLSPSQLDAQDARNVIQGATGIDVPVGIGEAVGAPELANNIKNIEKGSELSAEAKDALKRQVAFTATQLKNSGITENDLAKYTINTLRSQIGEISQPAKKAVAEAAKELHPQIKKAFNDIQNEADTLVPGNSSTPTSIGEKVVRGHLQGAFEDVNTAEKQAWKQAVNHPDYATVTVEPTNTQKWFSDLGDKTVQQVTPQGNKPLASMFPTGTGEFASTAPKIASNSTLEQMRNLRTQVGNSMGREDPLFPGRSDYEKKKLYSAISKDIDDGLSKLPNDSLKNTLQTAEKLTKSKFSTFNNGTIDKILRDYGSEEGTGPAGIASKITGPEAPAFLNEVKKAIGPIRANQFDKDIGGYLFNQVGKTARDPVTGEVSAGTILNNINALAPEIKAQYFPNYKAIADLARKQGSLSKVDAGKIMSNLSVDDPALLQDALGPKASGDVISKVSDAFKKSKKLQDRLNGTVAGSLAKLDGEGLSKAVQENPITFMRSITDGSFSPDQTRKAIGMIAGENPKLIEDLQFHYVNDLLSKSGEGRIGAANLLKDLQSESAIGKAGKLRETSDSILGANKTDTLVSMLRSLATIEKAGGDLSANSTLVDMLARGTGAAIGEAVKGSGIGIIGAANETGAIARNLHKSKYALASYILTTPELRRLAITPINRLDGPQLRQLVKGFTSYMENKVSPDSPDAEEIRRLNVEVNR